MGQQQQGDIVFQKEITEARLNPRCPVSIPGRALRLLPPFVAQGVPIEVEASDINGNVHVFKFKKRWTDDYDKPVKYDKPSILESCWVDFAAKKGLIPGNRITLYRILNEATGSYEYEVRCQRRFNLLGAELWLNVEEYPN